MTVIVLYEDNPPKPNSKHECDWCKKKVEYKNLKQMWDWTVCPDCFHDVED